MVFVDNRYARSLKVEYSSAIDTSDTAMVTCPEASSTDVLITKFSPGRVAITGRNSNLNELRL
jgi:hypothetical protein